MAFLRKLFSPLLNPLEAGSEPYGYQPSHRKILLVMAGLFAMLATVIVFWPSKTGWSFLFPALVFYTVAIVTLVVGALGSDRAVAKLWGTKSK